MLLLKTLLHTLLLPCTVAVWVPLMLLGSRRRAGPEWGALGVVGLTLLAVALFVFVWCTYDFIVKGRGTPNPLDPPKVVVATGPYRYVRNPMYVFATLFVVGEAALYRSPVLLTYAGFVLACFHLFVTLYEEPSLRRRFGAPYEDYCRRVPRWLPRLRRQP